MDGNDIDESELKTSGLRGIDQSFDKACTSPVRTYLPGRYCFECGCGFGMMDH
jgi:hypothetical protein